MQSQSGPVERERTGAADGSHSFRGLVENDRVALLSTVLLPSRPLAATVMLVPVLMFRAGELSVPLTSVPAAVEIEFARGIVRCRPTDGEPSRGQMP